MRRLQNNVNRYVENYPGYCSSTPYVLKREFQGDRVTMEYILPASNRMIFVEPVENEFRL